MTAKATDVEASRLDFEREKWRTEVMLRQRELDIKDREQGNHEAETELKRQEQASSKWRNPLVVAILAAAIAAFGNAAVTVVNGKLQRDLEDKKRDAEFRLEDSKAESSRILEMIKTGDPEKAASNLAFLLETGLVSSPERAGELKRILANRPTGGGPWLPTGTSTRFGFEPTEALTTSTKEIVEKQLRDYIAYLDNVGFKTDLQKVSIKIEKIEGNLAFSYNSTTKILSIDPQEISNIYNMLYPYTGHVLRSVIQNKETLADEKLRISNAYHYYFICSYMNNRRYHLSMMPASFKLTQCDDIYTKQKYLKGEPKEWRSWASVFWQVRSVIGENETDAIVARAWMAPEWVSQQHDDAVGPAFLKSFMELLAKQAQSHATAVRSLFREGEFPLKD